VGDREEAAGKFSKITVVETFEGCLLIALNVRIMMVVSVCSGRLDKPRFSSIKNPIVVVGYWFCWLVKWRWERGYLTFNFIGKCDSTNINYLTP
jgi:hypothetical protein